MGAEAAGCCLEACARKSRACSQWPRRRNEAQRASLTLGSRQLSDVRARRTIAPSRVAVVLVKETASGFGCDVRGPRWLKKTGNYLNHRPATPTPSTRRLLEYDDVYEKHRKAPYPRSQPGESKSSKPANVLRANTTNANLTKAVNAAQAPKTGYATTATSQWGLEPPAKCSAAA